MSRITRFSGRDPGPAARMSGFLTHLRENGLRLGVGETELALACLLYTSPSPRDRQKSRMPSSA